MAGRRCGLCAIRGGVQPSICLCNIDSEDDQKPGGDLVQVGKWASVTSFEMADLLLDVTAQGGMSAIGTKINKDGLTPSTSDDETTNRTRRGKRAEWAG